MRSAPRFAARLAWCVAAATTVAGGAAVLAEEPGVVVIEGTFEVPVQVRVQVSPAGAAEPEEKKPLEPLPPAPLLLEKVMRGFLEQGPARETLDEVMRRAAARRRAAAERAEAAQREQFVRQQAQQFKDMLEPLRVVELAFVRRTCGSLAPEARAEVLAASQQAIREVAERVARMQFEGGGDEKGPVDVRREIHEKVVAALQPRAAPEEFAAYERESGLRQERRAEAARMQIVAKLDERLGLTAAQRRDVLDDLRANWRPAWIRELEDHGVMSNDMPLAPDFAAASIEPHLDPGQQRQWRQWSEAAGAKSLPTNGIDWSEFNGLQQGQQKLEAWWRQ